jgi:translation elongation factor EF-Ts
MTHKWSYDVHVKLCRQVSGNDGETFKHLLTQTVGAVGENVVFRRACQFRVGDLFYRGSIPSVIYSIGDLFHRCSIPSVRVSL